MSRGECSGSERQKKIAALEVSFPSPPAPHSGGLPLEKEKSAMISMEIVQPVVDVVALGVGYHEKLVLGALEASQSRK